MRPSTLLGPAVAGMLWYAAVWPCAGGPLPGPASGKDPTPGRRHALLVGVTRYPALPPKFQLEGPANDVELLRRTLGERFGFPAADIVILTEPGRPQRRPTRSNIQREFRRLAAAARPGDQVVILLSGHGSQQPESDPPDPVHPEADGLDETFLPADVGPWQEKQQ